MPDIQGPMAFAAETILTTEQVAAWLQCSPAVVEGLHLPRLQLQGSRLVRYSAGMVLRYLEGKVA
ncbi:MAG: hypothetical protein AB7O32_04915 [Vicinamibacterales bacterium]